VILSHMYTRAQCYAWMMEYMWDLIYLFSMIKMYINKCYRIAYIACDMCHQFGAQIIQLDGVTDNVDEHTTSTIECYREGAKIGEHCITPSNIDDQEELSHGHVHNDITTISNVTPHDLTIYIHDGKWVVKECVNPESPPQSPSLVVECQPHFMSIVLEHNGRTYDIELKTDAFNFYMVHNAITKAFLYYYLVHVLKVDKSLISEFSDFTYTLEIIDSDVNMSIATHEDDIYLHAESHTIIPRLQPLSSDADATTE
jgi:hypothetical protein